MECNFKIGDFDRLELSYRYAHNLLSEGYELEFGVHIVRCEACQTEVDFQINLKRSFRRNVLFENLETAYNDKKWQEVIKLGNKLRNLDYSENVFKVNDKFDEARINLTYDDLCAAHNKADLEEVIRLGGEMVALGYSEEVHPIKEKVEHAKEQLSNVPIKVVVDDKEIFQNKVSEKKIIAIYPIVKVLIERGTDKLKELIIKDNMILGLPDQDETDNKIVFEDELIKIEFQEAEHEARLVLIPKE